MIILYNSIVTILIFCLISSPIYACTRITLKAQYGGIKNLKHKFQWDLMQWMLSCFKIVDEVIIVSIENSLPLFRRNGLKKLNVQKLNPNENVILIKQ